MALEVIFLYTGGMRRFGFEDDSAKRFGSFVVSERLAPPPDLLDEPEKVLPEVIGFLENPVVRTALSVIAPELEQRRQETLRQLGKFAVDAAEGDAAEARVSDTSFQQTRSAKRFGTWEFLPEVPRFVQFNELLSSTQPSSDTFPGTKPRSSSHETEHVDMTNWTALLREKLTQGAAQPESIRDGIQAVITLPAFLLEVHTVLSELETTLKKTQPVLEYLVDVLPAARWLSPNGRDLITVPAEDDLPTNLESFYLWRVQSAESSISRQPTFEQAEHALLEENDQIFTALAESRKFFDVTAPNDMVWKVRALAEYVQQVVNERLLEPYRVIDPHSVTILEQQFAQLAATIPQELIGDSERAVEFFPWDGMQETLQALSQSPTAIQAVSLLKELSAFEQQHSTAVVTERLKLHAELESILQQMEQLEKRKKMLEDTLLVLPASELNEE